MCTQGSDRSWRPCGHGHDGSYGEEASGSGLGVVIILAAIAVIGLVAWAILAALTPIPVAPPLA